MTLVAHHIIDVLRGKIKRPQLFDLTKTGGKYVADMAKLIEGAHKFDFGELILEVKENIPSGPVYALPALTADEMGFWRDGLIPLPFETCWFEFTLNGFRSGFLVQEVGTRWTVSRVDWLPDEVLVDGIQTTVDRAYASEDFAIMITGNTRLYHQLHEHSDTKFSATANSIASSPPLVVYFALMLNSKTTEAVKAPAPAAGLNRSRVRRGRAPLQEHSIITIVPARFRTQERADGKGAPRRLHWRRSHVRHYDRHTPASRWSPNLEHAGKKGWWVAVIPRMLVGHADLGEVSHEYRVAQVPHSETGVPA